MINTKAINKLDFNIIIENYKNHCKSVYGKSIFDKVEFFYDEVLLKKELELLNEFVENLRDGNILPLSGFPDITLIIQNIKKGLILDIQEAYDIFIFFKNSNKLIETIKKIDKPIFNNEFDIKYNFENQIDQIKHIFNDDGTISDNASSELFSIRKKIKKAEKEFLELISNIANKYKDYLVSENYILKEDRYLLPVKLSKKNHINGVAFGFSDSGKTILIEPLEIIELNNLIIQLKSDEEVEIHKILYSLTNLYLSIIDKIDDFIYIISRLDFLNAKAEIAFEKSYSKVEINNEYIFRLNNFYHPLLENPVKNNIEFGREKQYVVITGPNAGGKSVTLKAIGLIQMLFQAGFFVPASIGSTLPIMEDILIDIGDMQSIEQSLSTFSSHILELKEIINKANNKTLILIDELGTATSPLEGEVLAVSILEYLINKGSYGIITSHFDLVKKFAIENSSTIIASMLFDEKLMRPCYILMQDVPGYSYAFEIASRLGIEDSIIEKAKNIAKIDNENYSISRQLSDLVLKYKDQLNKLKEIEDSLIKENQELLKLKEKYNKTAKEIEKNILFETKNQLTEMKKWMENEIAILKNQGYSKERSKDLNQFFKSKEDEIINNLTQYEKLSDTKSIKEIENFEIGDTVEAGIFGKKGKIISIDKDKAKIQTDSLIIELSLKQLKKIEDNFVTTSNRTNFIPSKKLPSSIDIRGKTVEEARVELDFYFNEIINYDYEKIYIIHGKGTGKLANFVHDYLKNKKRIVESFHYASLNEGGAGCTIAVLKR